MKESHNRNATVVSVIIPTHNRRVLLQRTLDALGLQTYPLRQVEVLVIADGCTDGTTDMLRHYKAPFVLRIIEQPGQGAAAARNKGMAQASGQLFLFLDDDVEPTLTLIEEHVRAHQDRPGQVVIGPYLPIVRRPADFFHIQLQAWWESKFSALSQPGHRFTYQDLLSGNLSLDAELFDKVGGFDPTIQDCGGEDYEYGVRLIKANVIFNFAAGAIGYHHIHETTDLDRIFRRARQEGGTDVLIGQRHSELRAQLPLTQITTFRLRYRIVLQLFIFVWPVVADFLASRLQRLLCLFERAGLRHYWQRLYGFLHLYWYWRGVADKLSTRQALINFIWPDQASLCQPAPTIELDLSKGLETAEQQLDEERPMAARIRYGQQPVGLIPPQPGAERLRGIHLRPILANTMNVPLLEVLALEGAMTTSNKLNRDRLFRSVRSKSVWFGPTKIEQMWYEQYSQWNYLERGETKGDNSSSNHQQRGPE